MDNQEKVLNELTIMLKDKEVKKFKKINKSNNINLIVLI